MELKKSAVERIMIAVNWWTSMAAACCLKAKTRDESVPAEERFLAAFEVAEFALAIHPKFVFVTAASPGRPRGFYRN